MEAERPKKDVCTARQFNHDSGCGSNSPLLVFNSIQVWHPPFYSALRFLHPKWPCGKTHGPIIFGYGMLEFSKISHRNGWEKMRATAVKWQCPIFPYGRFELACTGVPRASLQEKLGEIGDCHVTAAAYFFLQLFRREVFENSRIPAFPTPKRTVWYTTWFDYFWVWYCWEIEDFSFSFSFCVFSFCVCVCVYIPYVGACITWSIQNQILDMTTK